MSQLVIDLPESLEQQIRAQGISQNQLRKVIAYLLELYLKVDKSAELFQSANSPMPRKAGSAKHLGICISDDFDEPLDDFAEYMP
ncbi:MAG: DUF2281 domain-containing protein [Caldilineaceae bacterium]